MKPKLHPELVDVWPIWGQIQILKQEKRTEYEKFMLPLPMEGIEGKKDRALAFRCGFINPTVKLIRAKGDAVFKKAPVRKNPSAGQTAFIAKADRSGQSLTELMHNEVAPTLAAYGTAFGVMDKPATQVDNKEQELASKLPFLTLLDPFQVKDFAWGADGGLDWFQYWVDAPIDHSDPWNPKRDPKWKADKGVATWTRTTYDVRSSSGKEVFVAAIDHGFDFVPVIIQTQYLEPNKTIGTSTFFTSSDYIVMGNNLNNCSDGEVFKNANTTLAINQQDWDDEQQPTLERSPNTNLRILNKTAHDVKNVFLYTKDKPQFIARDLSLIDKAGQRADKYFDLAIDNEKTSMSTQTGKSSHGQAGQGASQPQSGVSKSYDFVDINGMLMGFAANLQRFDQQALDMCAKMLDEDPTCTSEYSKEFDVRSFNQKLEFLKGLVDANYPSKQGMAEAYKSLTPEITEDPEEAAEIDEEIDTWAGEPEKAEASENQNICPNCGAICPPSATICPACGAACTATPLAKPPAPSMKMPPAVPPMPQKEN